ncbi:MAG TPA: hypothetical protein VGQ75_03285 [Thermoanaerobaculia bacterium]|nr:hypothetical protein [Thermoanaerobaculia bacterium]
MVSVLLSLAIASGVLAPAPARPVRPPPAENPAALGLAVNLPESAAPADRQRALDQVRRAGVSVFALEISWPAAEPRPRRYDVARVTHAARLLRQSGAVLHLDLPLVSARTRQVPSDLAAMAFDDPKLSLRLGRLFDALGPALLDFSTLSLGNEADSYFVDKPEELLAYRRLFEGAVEFLRKRAPRLLVGVATAVPMDSRAPLVAAALHQKSPALFYLYAPFLRDAPFTHRAPGTLDRDWSAILSAAGGRPVAFTEVSFSSAPENASSPEKQADFVRRMRRFLATTERSRLLFARYVAWRDPVPGSLPLTPGPLSQRERGQPPAAEGNLATRRTAFFSNRGLQKSDGTPKPAWKDFQVSNANLEP